ncbi:hypothetical protein HUW46_06814 [Amycolatopsis sp. CA-230715]|nr:hypothetical protein HUW46_06814 [Amycolatopsis sp. CA-230715]
MSDGAEFAEQIRFFSVERCRRHLRLLAERVVGTLGPVRVEIDNAVVLDGASQDFVRTVSRSGIELEFVLHGREGIPGDAAVVSYVSTGKEALVHRLVSRSGPLGSEDRAQVQEAAECYLNVGDGWSVVPLCTRLLDESDDAELHRMMGIALLLLGRNHEAEAYYLLWRSHGPRARANADYALAMLYARHHANHLRSLDKAEAYLEESYTILQELPADDAQQRTFDQVFNRNGLALVEYKRGLVGQAARRVQVGIDMLLSETPRDALHKAVLIYNVALCYQTLGKLSQARATFSELLRHDPRMPDYHLELARVHLALHDPIAAQESIDAAIALDEAISEAHSLRGYALAKQGRTDEAIAALRRAFRLDESSSAYAYDLAYRLNEAARLDEALQVLNTHIRHVGAGEVSPDMWSLRAEIVSHVTGLEAGRDILREALEIHPDNSDLRDNLATMETALSDSGVPAS